LSHSYTTRYRVKSNRASSPGCGIGEGGSPNNGPGELIQGMGEGLNAPLLAEMPWEVDQDVSGRYRGNLSPLSASWGNFLEELGSEVGGWDWFATMTFRDPDNPQYPNWTKPGWSYAQRALRHWADQLSSDRLGKSQPVWVAMMEYQHWRGVPHWHALVARTGDERRMDWVDWWYEHYGIARVLEYDHNLGARYYLAKYLTKEVADLQASPNFLVRHNRI
jgi:hypothetical protein